MDQVDEIVEKLNCRKENCESQINLKNFTKICACNRNKFSPKELSSYYSKKQFEEYFNEVKNDYEYLLDFKSNLDGINLNEKIIELKRKKILKIVQELKSQLDKIENILQNPKKSLKKDLPTTRNRMMTNYQSIKDLQIDKKVEILGLDRLRQILKHPKKENYSYVQNIDDKTIKNFKDFIRDNNKIENKMKNLKEFFFANLELMQEYKAQSKIYNKLTQSIVQFKQKLNQLDSEKDDVISYYRGNMMGFKKFYNSSCKRVLNYSYQANPFYFANSKDIFDFD